MSEKKHKCISSVVPARGHPVRSTRWPSVVWQEIIGKVTSMYKGMEFRVRCGEKVVPLEHVKVDMWRLLRKRDEDK